MSETSANESLHKEFELERLILFSDAVFAIAITLLILEIKFPEIPDNLNNIDLFKFFKPTFIHFFAFIISFFFIGMSWARHLALCKFLKRYNNTIIFLNLFLLFFIVIFPFSISAFIENVNHHQQAAIIIYISNILLVTFAQFLFAHYIIKKNKAFSTAGNEAEKIYFYLKARNGFTMMLITIFVISVVAIISKGNSLAITFSLYVLPAMALINKRRLKKYKPKSVK